MHYTACRQSRYGAANHSHCSHNFALFLCCWGRSEAWFIEPTGEFFLSMPLIFCHTLFCCAGCEFSETTNTVHCRASQRNGLEILQLGDAWSELCIASVCTSGELYATLLISFQKKVWNFKMLYAVIMPKAVGYGTLCSGCCQLYLLISAPCKSCACLTPVVTFFIPNLFSSLPVYFFDNKSILFPGQRS